MQKEKTHASLFELNGVPNIRQATPLAFQHYEKSAFRFSECAFSNS